MQGLSLLRAVLLHPRQSLWSSFPARRPARLCSSSCQPQEFLSGAPHSLHPTQQKFPAPSTLIRDLTPRSQAVLLPPPSPFLSLQFQGNLDVTPIRSNKAGRGSVPHTQCIPAAPRSTHSSRELGVSSTPSLTLGLEQAWGHQHIPSSPP